MPYRDAVQAGERQGSAQAYAVRSVGTRSTRGAVVPWPEWCRWCRGGAGTRPSIALGYGAVPTAKIGAGRPGS